MSPAMARVVTGADRPRLAPGVRLRHDAHRGQWVAMAPERLLMLDEIALEVLRHCEAGEASADALIDALARQYQAPRAEIAADVLDLLQELLERGFIRI